MVFSILSIYELDSNDYDIVKIILSGGNIIEENNKINNINNNEEKKFCKHCYFCCTKGIASQ